MAAIQSECEALSPDAETLQTLAAALTPPGPEADAACAALTDKLDYYLEQSALMDPVLPALVTSLATAVVDAGGLEEARLVFRVLYVVLKVRGVKAVTRLLPHEVEDFRAVIGMVCAAEDLTGERWWEVRYVLFVWLGTAVLVPFPLESIVAGAVVKRVVMFARRSLGDVGKTSAGAALLLAKICTRSDAVVYLRELIAWSCDGALEGKEKKGALTVLASVYKVGRREELVAFVPALLPKVLALAGHAGTKGDVHFSMKLAQRLALVYLPPRVCSWRYARGSRVMFGGSKSGVTKNASAAGLGSGSNRTSSSLAVAEDSNEADEMHIGQDGEQVLEDVIEILLHGLQNRDTVVRWSAAKGIGRVTGRLPLFLAQDVVDSVIGLFASPSAARADAGWHGGCLALAELARRGLILPSEPQFAKTFEVISRAASFDVRRGAHSIGAHVRDAACYGVWALSRAYAKEDMAPYASIVTNCMLPLALLDREINCRRAASAALQESVGRLSGDLFLEGIQLITLADYFSLGDRKASYLEIAPKIACLADGAYFSCITNELWTGKLVHWDGNVRILAAKALAAHVAADKNDFFRTTVVPKLVHLSTQPGDVVYRHGALLGIAELLLALHGSIPLETRMAIRKIPIALEKGHFYTGHFGNAMRMATCRLIECFAVKSGISYTDSEEGRRDAEHALQFLEDVLGCGKDNMYEAATLAYKVMCENVIALDVAWHTAVTKRILKGLREHAMLERQRGFALAAGFVGDSSMSAEVVQVLIGALLQSPDVEVRRNSAVSLSRVPLAVVRRMGNDLLSALSRGMVDFAVDDRGDVGSWVREATMRSAASIIKTMCSMDSAAPKGNSYESALDHQVLLDTIRCIARQCCGRIDRTRAVAGTALLDIHEAVLQEESGGSEVKSMLGHLAITFRFGKPKSAYSNSLGPVNFLRPEDVFESAPCLLAVEPLADSAVLGIVATAGGMGYQSQVVIEELGHYMVGLPDADARRVIVERIADVVMGKDERLVVPALVLLEALISRGIFENIPEACCIHVAKCARSCWRQKLRDVPRTSAAVRVLAELATLSFPGSVPFPLVSGSLRRACLEAMVVVLGGPLPRTRRITAECMYLALLEMQGDVESDVESEEEGDMNGLGAIEQAMELLTDTKWEHLSVTGSRAVRDKCCSLLHIDSPSLAMTKGTTT